MRQVWAVYLLRFSRESPVSYIFRLTYAGTIKYNKGKILQNTCNLELNQIIFNCLQTDMFIYAPMIICL